MLHKAKHNPQCTEIIRKIINILNKYPQMLQIKKIKKIQVTSIIVF